MNARVFQEKNQKQYERKMIKNNFYLEEIDFYYLCYDYYSASNHNSCRKSFEKLI